MSFVWPHLFWLLLIPGAGIMAAVTRRRRSAVNSPTKILQAEAAPGQLRLTGGRSGPMTGHPRWRLWLGIALLITALTRPQLGEVEEQVFDQAREIIIAVDLSRSMLAPDVPPSRLDRAKLLITSLLEQLAGERVGLIVFAGTAFLQSPLSADYEILREFLPSLAPDFLPQGGTNYTALLQTALDAFGQTSGTDRFLIILSDGESQTEDWHDLVGPLRERGVKAITLGIGTAEGAMLPDAQGGLIKDDRGAVVLSRLNAQTLEDLARRTQGVYRNASAWVDLGELLQQTVEAGRQGDFSETSRSRAVERFQWVLAPALLLLWWSFVREFTVQPKTRPMRASASAPARTGTASTVALLLLLISLTPARGSAPADTTAAYAAPLTQVVARLAQKEHRQASDYAEMAGATITYGQRLQEAGQRPEPRAIGDALDAVAAGEALDADAADWAKLREELKALHAENDTPPQDQSKSEDQQQKQQEEQQEQSEQDSSPKDSSGDPDTSDKKEEKESPQNQNQKGQDTPPNEQPSQQSDDSKGGEEESSPPPRGDSAFGEMDDTPPRPEPSPGEETQQVGGRPDRQRDEQQRPEMTVPMQKLEQLKQHDSPATLHQLMQDPNARPTPTGRDW